ncbi:MAG: carbon monoxide dehydrogenase subunit G [Clostridia bacterium]|nr:carbon monoxide dehydrogenase subunit G [Clostridia bacterium]
MSHQRAVPAEACPAASATTRSPPSLVRDVLRPVHLIAEAGQACRHDGRQAPANPTGVGAVAGEFRCAGGSRSAGDWGIRRGRGTLNITGRVRFEAGSPRVWSVLMDPQALAQAIPGCEALEPEGEGAYRARLRLGIAAVRGEYEARIRLEDVQEGESYRLRINGQGGAGFVEVDGRVRLEPEGAGATNVAYEFDAKVGGTVAAVGQRVLSGVAKLIVGEFFKSLARQAGREERGAASGGGAG